MSFLTPLLLVQWKIKKMKLRNHKNTVDLFYSEVLDMRSFNSLLPVLMP